ncbi:RHS repeat-associated core domain-containing protein [Streptomyces sp. NPDC006879]|uniref:RHS repeat-associated core domain-containing protein n=1 Tax=Streptomyces sp. NPDC006879 TaxID=3364767 RepID=UPI0036B569F4
MSVHPGPGGTRAFTAWNRRLAVVAGFGLLPGLLTPIASAAQPEPLGRQAPQKYQSSKVLTLRHEVDAKTRETSRAAAEADRQAIARGEAQRARKVAWPKPGTTRLTASAKPPSTSAPGGLPMRLAHTTSGARTTKPVPSGGQVSVEVLDQAAATKLGLKGVLLKVTGPTGGGRAQIDVDYSSFASAYGANWGARLRAKRLPLCALSRPGDPRCTTVMPLGSTNDEAGQLVKAELDFKPASPPSTGSLTAAVPAARTAATGETLLVALSAGASSSKGDYAATPLSASSSWESGGSSGSFTWSYALSAPPAAAGPQPGLAISYDSGSVDGRTASTNNQGTLVGEGFDLTSSFVERKYGVCDDDGQSGKYDLCWKYENASLVLNGKSTELVKDDTSGEWRLKNDDASTVIHSTGADNGDSGDDISGGKGDGKGEYWTVITGEGTKYVFGLNKLEGAGAERTESVWTVPVFGDDAGEPGYSSGTGFSGRWKRQAWRWNLDYVEDTRGNAMTYWYDAETNYYDTLGNDNNGTSYDRGGHLKEIRYGQRADALFSGASNKVVLAYEERCTQSGTGCSSLTKDTRDNWPDVPFDALCKAGAKCTDNVGPTFFTRKRLTSVTTYAWNAAASKPAMSAVDEWKLKQAYMDPGDTGDSTDQTLTLQEIRHTGRNGTDLTLDPVTFDYEMLPNRVDSGTDDILPFHKPRLRVITSETKATTQVSYMKADCAASQSMPRPDQNTRRCYPVIWAPNGGQATLTDWFHKYPVEAVSTTAEYGGTSGIEHSYTYEGGGAWHYNEDPFTKEKERTWSMWRGYSKVTHTTGRAGVTRSKTVDVYLRGMNGDRVLSDDGKTVDPDKRRSASVTGVFAGRHTDHEQYAGFARESVVYNGSTPISNTINSPWSKRTATQHKSYADTEAYYLRTYATYQRTWVTSSGTGTWRTRTTGTSYDSYGMPVTSRDEGDTAVLGDEKCTRTWYARNDAAGINTLVSRVRVTANDPTNPVANPCTIKDADLDLPADSSRAGQVISDTATRYDSTAQWTSTQKPTRGLARWTGRAAGYTSDDEPIWQKTSTASYDGLGRATEAKDTNDDVTATTTYTPSASGPLTSTVVTNAKGHSTTTRVDFATGAPVKVTDANGKVTESEYDSLGRVTKVWLPNQMRLLDGKPNYTYAYGLTGKAMPWVATHTLRGDGSGYNTSYQLYDSLLRLRQTQRPSPAGGMLVDHVRYDTRGLALSQMTDIWVEDHKPSSKAVDLPSNSAPLEVVTQYDGAERPIKVTTKNLSDTLWITTNEYTGDSVTSTAPEGGQATTVVTNALDQTTERREYPGATATGTPTLTRYSYTAAGQQSLVTGPDNAKWTYSYDLFGRQTETTDPDKGKTEAAYDELDRMVRSEDARGKVLLPAYDELGRQTGLWDGSKTNAHKLAAWTFDSLYKGQQDSATRYDGGLSGDAYTQKVTSRDHLYNVTRTDLLLPSDDPLVKAGVPANLSFDSQLFVDGTVRSMGHPAVAGLPSEGVSFDYDFAGVGLQTYLGGRNGYQLGATYSPLGELTQLVLGKDGTSSSEKAYLNYRYEQGTRRLTNAFVTDDVHSYKPQDLHYGRDLAGNVTSVFDKATLAGASEADYQCFDYDGYRRLVQAWTPKTADCSKAPTTAALDGAAPYWSSYTYTGAGQRKTETRHAASGSSTTNYTYGTPAGQPHALTKTATGSTTDSYTYDKSGNTLTRPGSQATQTLSWNTEGNLVGTSEPAAGGKPALGNTFLYDASGQLLIRRPTTADGETILYLPGGNEVSLSVKGSKKTLSGTRYYTAAGQTVAVRTATVGTSGSQLDFLVADHHGTSSLVLDADSYAVKKRYTTPFGAPRGREVTGWPDDKGFLGKPADPTTGLTYIGARAYDPKTGQFASVDPLLELDKHQTLNGYSYSINNPLTFSDPTGMGLQCGRNSGPENIPCPTNPATNKPGNGRPGEAIRGGGGNDGTSHVDNRGGTTSGSGGNSGASSVRKATGFLKGIVDDFNSLFYGTVSNVPHTASLFGWLVDGDCWNGGAGAPGCDYGGDFDDWVSSHDVNTTSDWYRAPSAIAAFFSHKPMRSRARSGQSSGRIKSGTNCKCFLAGTGVLMADGENKNIEDVVPGDKVRATDPVTGESDSREVERLIVTEDDKHFNKLSIATSNGFDELTATYEHPFWSPSEAQWINAHALVPGMTLLADDGSTVIVTTNHPFTKRARTYNLTVKGLHTYYVLAGSTPVLVHNSGPCPTARFVTDANGVTIDLKPLGRGSTGRTAPNSLNEQLAMETVMANPMAGRVIPLKKGMTDPRWMGSDGWVKMTRRVNMGAEGDVEIHYVMNTITGHVDDYKFK